MIDLAAYGLNPRRPEVIDSSMLKDFVDCPSYFYLRHVLGLQRTAFDPERQSPLDWGTVWHRVLETWRKTKNQVEALGQLDPWPATIMAETDKHGRSKERMARIFFEYVERYGEADDRDYDMLRAEQFFDVYDSEAGLRWCGRMDGILRRRRNGKIVVLDYKTTSRMGSYYFEGYEHSFQLPGYVWAAHQIITEPIEELLLDVLYTLKGSHQFFRRTVRYEASHLAEWRKNVMMWMEQLVHLLDNHLEDPEAWAKNWNQCTRYGICQFSDIHFAAPTGDSRLRIMQTDFHEVRWDPRRVEDGI